MGSTPFASQVAVREYDDYNPVSDNYPIGEWGDVIDARR
jgi:hypothetical protein